MIVPGNRFEYLEAQAALDAVDDARARPRDLPPRHARRARPAHPRRRLRRPVRRGRTARRSPLRRALCRADRRRVWRSVLEFIATGGYSLRAYDKFKRLVEDKPGHWRITQPAGRRAAPHERRDHRRRSDDGRPLQERPHARQGRGRLRLDADASATTSSSPGSSLEVERIKDSDIIVRASSKSARIVTYGGQRMSMSTHLAERVRDYLASPHEWARFPDDVREWLEVQQRRSSLPQPDELLVETFPHEGRHYMVHLQLRRLERAPVARHADHQADGDRGPQAARLRRQRLCPRRLRPRTGHRPRAPALARHPRTGIRRLGRAVAICSSAPSARSR